MQADPALQPERGQYGFLQELLRAGRLRDALPPRPEGCATSPPSPRSSRASRAPTRRCRRCIATHLLAAAEAAPDDPDVGEIRLRARAALVQAAERAAGLAAPEEAQRYLDQAAALASDEPSLQAELLCAGRHARLPGRQHRRGASTARAGDRALHEQDGDACAAARAGVALADVDSGEGRLEEARRRLGGCAADARAGRPEPRAGGRRSPSSAGCSALRGELEPAAATLERALGSREALALEEVLVQALTSKGHRPAVRGPPDRGAEPPRGGARPRPRGRSCTPPGRGRRTTLARCSSNPSSTPTRSR